MLFLWIKYSIGGYGRMEKQVDCLSIRDKFLKVTENMLQDIVDAKYEVTENMLKHAIGDLDFDPKLYLAYGEIEQEGWSLKNN